MKLWQRFLILLILPMLPLSAARHGEVESSRLFARQPDSEALMILPLEGTDVLLEVTGGIVTATVTQTFVNHTPHTLEAIYTFPLPSKAAVTDMELQVGDRIIRSVVQEKEQAKKTYEAAKEEGKKTALVEQKRPNIFTTSVANFGPGERVSIQLQYMESLPYQKGQYTVRFPMVVGQRYLPPELVQQEDGSFAMRAPDPEDQSINPPLLPTTLPEQANLSLEVTVQGIPLREVHSNTHAIRVEPSAAVEGKTHVTLSRGQVVPHADFDLKLLLKEQETPDFSFVESSMEEERYGLLTLFPPTVENPKEDRRPRDVVFLIDTSGSMSGESIGQARTGLKKCMEMLRPEDRFNIIRFASDYSSFAPDFRTASPEKVAEAQGYIANLEAGGGTEMHPALRHALSFETKPGHLKLVIFLTDGNVGNEDELMRLLEQELGRARMFTFAIGSAPNEFLVRAMAEQGRGQARFINSHEDIGTEMTDFFRTLEAPVLTDIRLSWQDRDGNTRSLLGTYPSPCPDVFFHRPIQVVVSAKEAFEGQVTIQGVVQGERVTFVVPIESALSPSPAAEKLYGRAMIQNQMLDWIRADTPVVRTEIRESIVETALKHQLVSKFTSRVAVEEQVSKEPDGSLKTVQVKVPLPKGWDPAVFSSTATLDPLLFLIGGQMLLVSLLLQAYRRRVRS